MCVSDVSLITVDVSMVRDGGMPDGTSSVLVESLRKNRNVTKFGSVTGCSDPSSAARGGEQGDSYGVAYASTYVTSTGQDQHFASLPARSPSIVQFTPRDRRQSCLDARSRKKL